MSQEPSGVDRQPWNKLPSPPRSCRPLAQSPRGPPQSPEKTAEIAKQITQRKARKEAEWARNVAERKARMEAEFEEENARVAERTARIEADFAEEDARMQQQLLQAEDDP